jgi:hypothetical protein
MKYQVYAIDAWATDEEGGWDTNDWHKAGIVEIPTSFENNEIIERMIDEGYLKPKAIDLVYCDDICDTTIRISADSNFQPLYDLVLIEGGE